MAVGALLALVANPSWAPVRLLALPESIVALARVTYKAALCCVMVGPALALAAAPKLMRGPLTQLGRSSLLVYWVHLQFAFGTVSRPLARSLTLEAWIYGTVVLMACMWGLAALRSARLTRMFRELTQAARNRLKSRISPAI
jgi:fucose 4-O-acetylase-like acetyltransferase